MIIFSSFFSHWCFFPNITDIQHGKAQVNYRYGASVEDALRKLEYDLYYPQIAQITQIISAGYPSNICRF